MFTGLISGVTHAAHCPLPAPAATPSTDQRFELLLQLLHQKFTPGAQRFKAGSLAKVVAVQLEGIKHREKTPEVRTCTVGQRFTLGVDGDERCPITLQLSLSQTHAAYHAHNTPAPHFGYSHSSTLASVRGWLPTAMSRSCGRCRVRCLRKYPLMI